MSNLSNMEVIDLLSHFPSQVSQDIVNFASEVAFKGSRYIFTRRVDKKQYGYCTHCNKEYLTNRLTHNSKAICPECKSKCIVKASGLGRKRMIDEVYFVYFEKSILNPQAITARGIYAVRDYRENYRKVETNFKVISMYLFEPGNSIMMKRWAYYSGQYGECRTGSWEKCGSIHTLFNHDHIANIRTCYSRESIKEAVKGTSFSWSGWENYNIEDMVKFFDLFAKYPSVEYLTKLSFDNLIRDKLVGNRTYSAVNWRGTNLFKVLKITKQELKIIKSQRIHVTFEYLKFLQMSRKDGSNFTLTEVQEVANKFSSYIDELAKLHMHGGLRKITNYLTKQFGKYPKHFNSETSALITWKDYIADCIELDMDLKSENVLFPKNLYRKHQNTLKQVKIYADEILNKKIMQRAKNLEGYCFEYAGLLIRPAANANELINEGKILNHCVGTYAKRYAKGQTGIFFIRNLNELDKPYFTAEIQKDRIIQVRGKNNCSPNEAISEFVKVFKEQRLDKKEVKNRVRVAVSA